MIVEVPSLKVLFANRHAETITQASLGRPAKLDLNDLEGEILYPDGRKYDKADWPIMRATRGQKVSDEECVYVLPDGSSMTVLVSSAPVYDTEGDVVAAVAVARDVTEQDDADSASLRPGL
jgi:PAS domain-containing protein